MKILKRILYRESVVVSEKDGGTYTLKVVINRFTAQISSYTFSYNYKFNGEKWGAMYNSDTFDS